MSQKSIMELIQESLEGREIDLHVFPGVFLKMQETLSRKDYEMGDLVNILIKDQALVATILKMANSPLYAGLRAVRTIQEAIVRLGAKSISNLVAVIAQKEMYGSRRNEIQHHMKPLWRHALGTALAARWLASRLGLDRLCEESFLAGLLHDIGKLFLLKVIEHVRDSGLSSDLLSKSLIDDVLDTMHCSQGERLLTHLNLPEVYRKIAARHHEEKITGDDILLNVVRLANLTCHRLCIGLKHDPDLMLSTTPEAVTLMASDLLLAELQVETEEQMALMESSLTPKS